MNARVRALLAAGGQVCTLSQLRAVDVDEVATERLVRSGLLVRLRRGLFVSGEVWREATPEARLSLCTRAVLRERPDAAASHASAAVVHGLPLWGVGTSVVDVVCGSPRRRSRRLLRLHPWPDGVEAVTVDGQRVVPVATAIAQIVDEYGYLPGLVCLDRALHEKAVGAPAVLEAGEVLGLGRKAERRMRQVVADADPDCESAGETRTRVLLRDLGQDVRSQVDTYDRQGHIGRVDFLVGERVIVEFDGLVKYAGADGRAALAAEKVREDRLRAAGYEVIRLVWADLDHPERVLDRVQRALGIAA